MTNPATPIRRHSFYDIFSGARPHVEPRTPFRLPQGKSEPAHPPSTTTTTTRNAAATTGPTVDTSWFRPSAPVSLDALQQAIHQAGLNPTAFTFEQVEASGDFPERPDLSYITRQLVIRGPHGAGMFDRDLALRTPWVTAVELQTYGIA